MTATILQSLARVSEGNADILLRALKEIGGFATVTELNRFLWLPENRERFARHGRAWSEHFCQHDLHYLSKQDRVIGLWDGSKQHRYVWYLSGDSLSK